MELLLWSPLKKLIAKAGYNMTGIRIADELWDTLKENLLAEYFQYGRQALYPVIEIIITNLQSLCEVYRNYPDVCINLLNQVMQDFTKAEYEEKILTPISNFVEQEPALQIVVENLRNLRKFLGENPSFVEEVFSREINILKDENKAEIYREITTDVCKKSITKTIELINIHSPREDNRFTQS